MTMILSIIIPIGFVCFLFSWSVRHELKQEINNVQYHCVKEWCDEFPEIEEIVLNKYEEDDGKLTVRSYRVISKEHTKLRINKRRDKFFNDICKVDEEEEIKKVKSFNVIHFHENGEYWCVGGADKDSGYTLRCAYRSHNGCIKNRTLENVKVYLDERGDLIIDLITEDDEIRRRCEAKERIASLPPSVFPKWQRR